jgi:hypothetical protein
MRRVDTSGRRSLRHGLYFDPNHGMVRGEVANIVIAQSRGGERHDFTCAMALP